MSYCRWSSDDFACDLYAYEAIDGYTIHIANNRVLGDIPKVPWILDVASDVWVAAHMAQQEFLRTAQRERIGLPHDGETFVEDDLDDFEERLRYLREIGYKFPDDVFVLIAEDRGG